MDPKILSSFEFEGKVQSITFVETIEVSDGVQCDVYTFNDDDSKDLAVIQIFPGKKTPLQRVLSGIRTVEGYISGEGCLTVTRKNKQVEKYEVGAGVPEKVQVDVEIGDLMQWHAGENSELIAYEICFPPYQDGRYENL